MTDTGEKICKCGTRFIDRTFNKNQKWCSEKCRCHHKRQNSSLTKEVEMKKNLVDVAEFSAEMLERFKSEKQLFHAPKRRALAEGKITEAAVLMLSDIHCGQTNKFLGEDGNMVVTYNTEIMVKEFDRLLDGIFTINELLSNSYNLEKLYIFGLGDYLENDVIFNGQRFFIDKGVGEQMIFLADALSQFFRELLKTYKEIEFVCVIGNHGRFATKKEANPTSNNFDYLMGKFLQAILKDEPRIKVVVPESWYYMVQIYGWKYFLHHGDTVYSWMSLPYYGLKRQGIARRVEMPFDIECIGHFHQRMEIPVSSNSITLVNGGWIEKSDWGWRKFGNLSKPEQYYFGVSPHRPRSWCYSIELLRQKGELKKLLRGRK
jgi:predicted phosphodiesterase